MAEKKILIPYNFAAVEEKALSFVISTFSSQRDVKITLLNTYVPLPDLDMSSSPDLQKMKEAVTHINYDIKEKEKGLKSMTKYFMEHGFFEEQIDYIFRERRKSVAEEVVKAALEGKYDIIVLSRQAGKVSRFFAKSVHNKLLSSLKNVTICIAN